MSLTDKKKSLGLFQEEEVDPTPKDFRERFLLSLAKRLGKSKMIKKTRTVNPKYIYQSGAKVRHPEYDYSTFITTAKNSWILRKVFETIIRTATRNWGEIAPRFKVKCKGCGWEFNEETEKCPYCGGTEFSTPDPKQLLKFKKILKEPSPGRSFYEFVRSTLFYELAVDDFYWSLTFNSDGTAKEIFVENPAFIFPVGDEYGIPGGDEYFCPVCYNKPENKGKDLVWKRDELTPKKITIGNKTKEIYTCPECGEILVQTYYVQEVSGKVKARFGKNEILHGSASRLPPELFGNSKIQTVLKAVNIANAIDDYNLESRMEGKVGGLLCFPKLDQNRVGSILTAVQTERNKLSQPDLQTGELGPQKKTALIFIGLGEETDTAPVFIPFIDPKEAERTIELYRIYMAAIDDVYGTITSLHIQQVRGGQIVRLSTEVRLETALEHQRLFSEVFNEKALPLFGITDWIWKFNPLEAKDKLRAAEIKHQNAAAALTAVQAGFDVKWVDDEAIISGEAKAIPFRTGRQGLPNQEPGVAPRRPSRQFVRPIEISPETGQEITASLVDKIIDFISSTRVNSQRGKEQLRRLIYDEIFNQSKNE